MYSGLIYGKEAREKLARGVKKLVDAVKVTLGGNGKNVIIFDNLATPHITKDGLTVSKSVNLMDTIEQGGVEIVRQAAKEAADKTADGTSTATVIAGALISKGIQCFDEVNIQDFKVGMQKAQNDIKKQLRVDAQDISENVEKVKSIATISANGDKEIGSLVGEVVFNSGSGVDIVVERDTEMMSGLRFELKKGYTYKKGVHPFFETTPGSSTASYGDVSILILDCHLGNLGQIEDVLVEFSSSKEPLIIMSKTVDPLCVQRLAVLSKQGDLKSVYVELPDFGDMQDAAVGDLCACTGATAIRTLDGMTVKKEHTGKAFKFEGNGTSSTIVFVDDEKVKEQIELRTKSLKESFTTLREDEAVRAKERYKRLSDGVGVIKIGATTDTEYFEIKDRVDDAIGSSKSALEEGVVSGGGVALIEACDKMERTKIINDSEEIGYDVVVEACYEPFIQILGNCSEFEWEARLDTIRSSKYILGFDAKNKKIDNLKEKGIIDAVKVTSTSLDAAISATVGILTTDCIIYPQHLTDEKKESIPANFWDLMRSEIKVNDPTKISLIYKTSDGAEFRCETKAKIHEDNLIAERWYKLNLEARSWFAKILGIKPRRI